MSTITRTDVEFDSHGTRCAAWHYEPTGSGPQPYVVMAHGLGATRELALEAPAERFAQAGFGVFVFDYRHFGGSGGEPRELISIRRQLQDWEAAVNHVRGLPGADKDRVAIWGSSFAGGHVIVTAAKVPGVAAAVSQVPFTDGLQSLLKTRPLTAVKLMVAGLIDAASAVLGREPHYVKLVGRPGDTALMASEDAYDGYTKLVPQAAIDAGRWHDRAAARIALTIDAYAPRRFAKRVRCPLLIVAAEGDTLAPARGAKAAAKAAPSGELLVYERGHFDYYVGEGFERIVADELGFLTRVLQPAAQPAAQPA